ncbi:MAG: hypothetical protein A2289_22640 [Deltaproteobacteria bacterium RIFOXYA12_FULL_58_15]|nr:MAG: hypothetical protein A2289_22640 [Deltaproteobacteria bacterium RIFOXYA12_FULL_58_15]
MTHPTVILGAGLTGLSCAYHLDGERIVIEREAEVGGTARSSSHGGFTFDCTGHWLHLSDKKIRSLVEELLPGELLTINRRSEVHLGGMRTPYPFQANTYGRDPRLIAQCVLGFFEAREAAVRGEHQPPKSFEEYIRQKMGNGIAEHFMIPYNRKLWTIPPNQMAHEWCGRFVPIPTPEEVVLGAVMPDANGTLGYNASFLYPKSGGIGRLPRALELKLDVNVRLHNSAVVVDWEKRTVGLSDGTTVGYRSLVSTLPITDLVGMLRSPPGLIVAAAGLLHAASVTYWDVGVAGTNPPGSAHWIYFPESEIPFYRAGSASAVLSTLAPSGHRSYYVEVSHRRGTLCPVSTAEIIAGMRAVGLLGANEEPVVLRRTLIECAYVIMDAAYGASRATVLDWLGKHGIVSVGRYGAWTYDSMEGAMIQGRDAAQRVRELRNG